MDFATYDVFVVNTLMMVDAEFQAFRARGPLNDCLNSGKCGSIR